LKEPIIQIKLEFPDGFVPKAHGMILVDDNGEPVEPADKEPVKPTKGGTENKAQDGFSNYLASPALTGTLSHAVSAGEGIKSFAVAKNGSKVAESRMRATLNQNYY